MNSLGEIDYDTLNRRRFSDPVEMGAFYESLKDFVLARLGAPVVRVELTDFQILTTIDEAISKLDYHAPSWCTNYMTFTTVPSYNIYELPRFVMNNMQYVVYKKSLLAVAAAQGSLEFDFFIKYFQDNFLMRDFSISDFLLMQMHLEQIRKILSRDGTFDVVDNRFLMLHPTPTQAEEVIVQFRSLNSDSLHPFFVGWIQRFAAAVSKIILGGIRGKYDTLPSPGGGARLNGSSLVEEGNKEKEVLIEELLDEIEDPPVFTTF
tara:strand:- start:1682 stop:2470 length:789 start_codon:yes stop_codon:yes gene_type:complete